ncbi:peroxidase family protein [Solirubrobacter deserti]|uniref:Heme peroxidase n=1 Tax=Solirubrobacter deserti TaxID=2282478 RepID=A0ABT4RR12_9ACTN|nr:hypothetical protein [Solirubrobacter deserti]MDA0140900.1 hypothetical protein [Solirubrobacter deserti]
MVLHEFLVKTVGEPLVKTVLDTGPKYYSWRHDPYIPVEFSVGAYRFGHSQVRPSYRANFGTNGDDIGQQFFAFFSDHQLDPTDVDPADLRGGCRAPRRFIDWQTFFDKRTPLWFYVLREADLKQSGQRLGPVGGRIVAEVIIGLIRGDRDSYLRQDPEWTPTYGAGDGFTMVDLLNTAEVVAKL